MKDAYSNYVSLMKTIVGNVIAENKLACHVRKNIFLTNKEIV